MDDQVPIGVRRALSCLIIGAGLTFLFLLMMGLGVAPRTLHIILRPGLQLAKLMKFGVESGPASILVVVGNSLFYGAIAMVIMLLAKKR